MADTYFLYQHKDPITGTCMYVGMGSIDRAFKTIQRNSKYKEHFKNISPKIEIIREFSCKRQASSAERNIINLIRPALNIVMQSYRKDTIEKRIALSLAHGAVPFSVFRKSDNVFMGTFINQTEAASVCGVSRSAISNVLCGRAKSLNKYSILKEVQ